MRSTQDDEQFFMVMLRSSPKDILALCQTDQRMNLLCRKPRVIETLMTHYFPHRRIDRQNAYRQFVMMANTVTTYVADNNGFGDQYVKIKTQNDFRYVPEYRKNKAYIDTDGLSTGPNNEGQYAVIKIDGAPFDEPVKLWVLMHDFNPIVSNVLGYNSQSPYVIAFRTRTEAIQSTVEMIFGPILRELQERVDDGDYETVDEAAKAYELPSPISIEGLTRRFEKDGVIIFGRQNTAEYLEFFTIRELTFLPERHPDVIGDDEE